MRKIPLSILLLVAAAIVLAGCAARRGPYDDLYRSLREKPRALDWSVLEGRRIVIDPGHGGHYEGALGLDSLKESDVNLGVALYLWGMLEEAGADVHLTRTTDRDFLPMGSTEIVQDLTARVKLANELEPEVFISIHHNSNIELDRTRNMIEIYHRSTGHGGSVELAGDILRHLSRNLGIEETGINPGNYFVLRHSGAGAAVLGEASYLSHPVVEDRLKLAAKQRIEAEAYFLGLATYFSRGVPVIERIDPPGDTLQSPEGIAFRVRPAAGVPLDPSSARITVGTETLVPVFDSSRGILSYRIPQNAPNRCYDIRCTIRSCGGATASNGPFTLLLARPAAYFLPLPAAPARGGGLALGVKVLDRLGRAVADGTPVTARPLAGDSSFDGACRDGRFVFTAGADIVGGEFVLESTGATDTLHFDTGTGQNIRPLLLVDRKSGSPPVESMMLVSPDTAAEHTMILRGGTNGIVSVPRLNVGSLLITATGYRPVLIPADSVDTLLESQIVWLDPVFGGILSGKRIVLDPAGGGVSHGGLGKNKLRGSTVNLGVARLARDRLVKAGALVSLTRGGEEPLSPIERVHRVNRFRPDLAIGIHHEPADDAAGAGCTVLHYPGSVQGSGLARSLAESLSGLPPCEQIVTLESAAVFLSHTSCPACEIHFGSVEDESAEEIFSSTRFAYLEADRIVSAIVRQLAGETWSGSGATIRIVSGGNPVPGAVVSIDQVSVVITDGEGTAEFACIAQGKHFVTVETPGDRSLSVSLLFTPDDARPVVIDVGATAP